MDEWPIVESEDIEAAVQAIKDGALGSYSGKNVMALEQEFAASHDARYGVGVSSGSVALLVALRALGVKDGDEVLVPAYNFIADATCVIYVNAIPVFVDSEPDSLTLSVSDMKKKITSRTKAVIATHVSGCIAPMDEVTALAKQYGIAVINDCALAHGAIYDGKKLGAYGDISCFSFGGVKLMAASVGGMLLTNDLRLKELCFSLANHGALPSGCEYKERLLGFNFKLPELQAALLRVQLRKLDGQTIKREENAGYLTERLKDIPGIHCFKRQSKLDRGAYYQYSFYYDPECFNGIDCLSFVKVFNEAGIPAIRHFNVNYNLNVDQQWQDFSYFTKGCHNKPDRCENAERHAKYTIGIRHTYLLKDTSDMDKIVDAIESLTQEKETIL